MSLTHRPSTPPTTPADDVAGQIDALRHRVDGDVLLPDDPGFAEAALAWNRAAAHDPAVIVVANDVGDILATVAFAAALGRGLGVQATGHGVVCPSTACCSSPLDSGRREIDPEERTAWVAAGGTWGPVLAAAQAPRARPARRLVTDRRGGRLHARRRAGLAGPSLWPGLRCRALVRGRHARRRAGARLRDEHPELFRALRGGGGGGGVVTDMEIELFPVRDVYARQPVLPGCCRGRRVERWSHGWPTCPTS